MLRPSAIQCCQLEQRNVLPLSKIRRINDQPRLQQSWNQQIPSPFIASKRGISQLTHSHLCFFLCGHNCFPVAIDGTVFRVGPELARPAGFNQTWVPLTYRLGGPSAGRTSGRTFSPPTQSAGLLAGRRYGLIRQPPSY